jgi:hypothetical protein
VKRIVVQKLFNDFLFSKKKNIRRKQKETRKQLHVTCGPRVQIPRESLDLTSFPLLKKIIHEELVDCANNKKNEKNHPEWMRTGI